MNIKKLKYFGTVEYTSTTTANLQINNNIIFPLVFKENDTDSLDEQIISQAKRYQSPIDITIKDLDKNKEFYTYYPSGKIEENIEKTTKEKKTNSK